MDPEMPKTDESMPKTPKKKPCGCSMCFWVIVIAAVVVIAAVGVFPFTGIYNVSAVAGHTRVVAWYLEEIMENSVEAHAGGIVVPADLDTERNMTVGYGHYHEMCVGCHGAPGEGRNEIGLGITPLPPLLVESADEWTTGEVFWIVQQGIKMAGMPAFGPTHTEDQLWAMTAFVKALPTMTAEQYKSMAADRSDVLHEQAASDPKQP